MSSKGLEPYIIVNRTESNKQIFNISISKDLDFLKINKVQMFSKDELGQLTQFNKDYDNSTTRLYESQPMIVGVSTIEEVSLKASLETRVDKGQKVKMSLGPFPIDSTDNFLRRLNIVPNEPKLRSYNSSSKEGYSLTTRLKISFNE